VTDAAAILGMLAGRRLAGGTTVNVDRARSVLTALGEPLALSAERAATGVIAIAVSSMAGAIRTVTIHARGAPRARVRHSFDRHSTSCWGVLCRRVALAGPDAAGLGDRDHGAGRRWSRDGQPVPDAVVWALAA
ncbi:MAG: hypothetical protein E6G67_11675, partial [Actinobacteria bacterium]